MFLREEVDFLFGITIFLTKKFQMSDNEKVLYLNYIDYFEKLTKKRPKNPTIFLFDNMSRQESTL